MNCEGCRYISNHSYELPCCECTRNYSDKYQVKEDTTPIDFGCGSDGCEINWESDSQ